MPPSSPPLPGPPPRAFPVADEPGVVLARHVALEHGQAAQLSPAECEALGIAVLEIVRNAVCYAGRALVSVRRLQADDRQGVEVLVLDEGPGMDVEHAMADGFSTSGGLGHGLPGARRMASELEIDSERGKGTRIRLVKWHTPSPALVTAR